MITKTDNREYHVQTIGREIDIILSEDELLDRLRKCGVWREDQLEKLVTMNVGDTTPRPKGAYL